MKLLVTTDAHILKTSDGMYWCAAIYGYDFWMRFLNVYDEVRIAARVKRVEAKKKEWKRVDGPNVEIYEIPFFQGPIQLLKRYGKIQQSIRKVGDNCDAVLYRLPSPIGQLIWRKLEKKKMPTGLEVVYDLTDDMYDPNRSKILKLITYIQLRFLKKACVEANGVSYVTEKTIQKNFPSFARLYGEDSKHFETYYSTITLKDNVYTKPRDYTGKNEFTLALSDVAMNSERKGERVFLQVIYNLRRKGYNLHGVIIGDGSKRKAFEQLSRELGIDSYVEFTGMLGSAYEVMDKLKETDIFVFPTVAEGLPRGVLEAMAVGMPVVTSPVGGIPEIIRAEQLAKPYDVDRYTEIVEEMINNLDLMNKISYENFNKSLEFRNKVLEKRRNDFYFKLSNI